MRQAAPETTVWGAAGRCGAPQDKAGGAGAGDGGFVDPETKRRAGVVWGADDEDERRRRQRAQERQARRSEQLKVDLAKPAEKKESARERLQR